jgi:hypothetical protein
MQEVRGFKPSTVSRRFSVAAGFYRTCVVDGLLEHSPAERVRRPAVSAESPTLGFTHLQFEALLTTARESSNPCDFALVAMPGLLGLRIFEATAADIADLDEEHGHRVLRVRQRHQGRLDPAPASGRAGRRPRDRHPHPRPHPAQQPRRPYWTGTPPSAARGTWLTLLASRSPGPTRTCSATPSSRPCLTRAWTCGTSRSPPVMPIHAPRCVTAEPAITSTVTRTTSWPEVSFRSELLAWAPAGWRAGPATRRVRLDCAAASLRRSPRHAADRRTEPCHRGYGMRALLVIAVAAQAVRRVHAGRGLFAALHAADPVADEYRDELRGQTGLTA